jgi:hypothetical protein
MPGVRTCECGCGRRFVPRSNAQRFVDPAHRVQVRIMQGRGDSERYGKAYRLARARWSGSVMSGLVKCGRCGELIKGGDSWHLDHLESGLLAPSHAECNMAAGGATTSRLARDASKKDEPGPCPYPHGHYSHLWGWQPNSREW